MIIEGRHAEVGSGIFISDIQPESVAEQVFLQLYIFPSFKNSTVQTVKANWFLQLHTGWIGCR
jgi:hypothetical protein